jgi:hypothetical protein
MITIELWNIQETTLTAANFPSKFGILQTVTLDDLVDAHLTRPGAVSSDLWAPRRGNRKGQAMNTKMMKNVMALGAGGALVAGAVAIATASPSWTMPVLPNTAAVTTAASNQITDVRYYRRGYYGRAIMAVATVVAIMAVAITVVAMVTGAIPMLILILSRSATAGVAGN